MTQLNSVNNIVTLTLNNPPGNILTEPAFIDLDVLHLFLQENKSRTLIISGAGRHFSSGADLNIINRKVKEETLFADLQKGKELLNYLYNLDIPVISAIEGVCFGGGLEIALSSHIRVISEKSLLAFPETMHNLMPGLSGNYLVKRYLTMGKSLEFILANKILTADQAIKEGIADYLCPAKTSYEFALDLADKMTRDKPIEVINSVMKAIKNSYRLNREDALEQETLLFCQLAKNAFRDA